MDAGVRSPHSDQSSLFTLVFEDGIGQRLRARDLATRSERLRLRSAFAATRSFEFCLREQVARLEAAQVPGIARVLGVARAESATGDPELSVVTEAIDGIRLSTFIAGLAARGLTLDIHAGLALLRQVASTTAHLHQVAPHVAHGALGPERIVLGPQGRVVVTEAMLGPALECLRYSRERYWTELQVPLPDEPVRFDQRADVLQLGMVALALIHGRLITVEQFPRPLADLVTSTWALSADGGVEPLPPGLRGWLRRALQLEGDRSFATAVEAHAALGLVLGDGELLASTFRLRTLLARYQTVAVTGAAKASPALVAAVPDPVRPPDPIEHVVALAAPWRPEDESPKALALVGRSSRPGTSGPAPSDGHDWVAADADGPLPIWRRWRVVAAAAVVFAVLATGAVVIAQRLGNVGGVAGTLVLSTMPAGVDAFIDGQAHGPTPISVQLAPGTHRVELKATGMRKSLDITIQPRQKVTQSVKLSKARPPARATSRPAPVSRN